VALAFGFDADPASIPTQGIRHVTRGDVVAARERGFVLRHLVQADVLEDGLRLAVGPVLLPEGHPLAWSKREFNSLLVRGDAVGETIYHGKGAGPIATASAVLADVVDVAASPFVAGAPRRAIAPRISGRASAELTMRLPGSTLVLPVVADGVPVPAGVA
jgi:homoserine dehydrogenase